MNDYEPVKITKKRGISRIWLIPIIATLIGLWMIFKYLDDRGIMITIAMPNAEGVTVGKTLIKTRSVSIGMVRQVKLAENLQQVLVSVEIEKPYINLLKSDSIIWAVEPRIDETGISGFSTILSGIYFELQPGSSKESVTHYDLLDSPPPVSKNVKGRRFRLQSNSAEVLQVGAPVIYKGVKVGSIEETNFDWYSETMNYLIFIEEPNYNLVTDNTLFWVDSGIELDLSADGINFKTGSLSQLLAGGITFGRPEREPKGRIAKDGQRFILSANFKESLEERYDDYEYYAVILDQSVRGLRPGAPVEFRGVRVGTVVEVPAVIKYQERALFLASNDQRIPVLIKIEFQRIYHDSEIARDTWINNIRQWINDGLKLSLQTGNLLTGGLFLEFGFYPNEDHEQLETIANYKIIPSTSSGGLSQLSAQMSDFLNKLNRLNIEQTLVSIDKTLLQFSQLAEKTEGLVNDTKRHKIPNQIDVSLRELQTTLKDFQRDGPVYTDIQKSLRTLEQLGKDFQSDTPLYEDIRRSIQSVEQLSHDFQNGAPAYNDIRRALQSIDQLTRELQPFSKRLNEHPSILIFDKAENDDVQPLRGASNE